MSNCCNGSSLACDMVSNMDIAVEKQDIFESQNFPPGTVQLGNGEGTSIVLKPTPSADPNDPLVSVVMNSLNATIAWTV